MTIFLQDMDLLTQLQTCNVKFRSPRKDFSFVFVERTALLIPYRAKKAHNDDTPAKIKLFPYTFPILIAFATTPQPPLKIYRNNIFEKSRTNPPLPMHACISKLVYIFEAIHSDYVTTAVKVWNSTGGGLSHPSSLTGVNYAISSDCVGLQSRDIIR